MGGFSARPLLRRGAVHLVGEDDVAEDRSGLEPEYATTILVGMDDVCSHDVAGHQVRRELDARELEAQHAGASEPPNPIRRALISWEDRRRIESFFERETYERER